MKNLLSKREYAGSLPRTRLNAVWYVDADRSYSVSKWNRQEAGCVAVRTVSGMGRMELRGGGTFMLPADSLGVFDMRQVVGYSAGKDGWQFYWFEFSTDGEIFQLPGRMTGLRVSAQEQTDMERCFQCLSRNTAYECLMAESLFRCLLAGWQIRAAETEEGGGSGRNLMELLENGRRERTGIAELAREAGMCERSFRDAVRRATGLSPKAYMLKGEMAAAMELLRTTDMTVSEIAALFNYSSPFYFSRVFRRYYGLSPKQARSGEREERCSAEGGEASGKNFLEKV